MAWQFAGVNPSLCKITHLEMCFLQVIEIIDKRDMTEIRQNNYGQSQDRGRRSVDQYIHVP